MCNCFYTGLCYNNREALLNRMVGLALYQAGFLKCWGSGCLSFSGISGKVIFIIICECLEWLSPRWIGPASTTISRSLWLTKKWSKMELLFRSVWRWVKSMGNLVHTDISPSLERNSFIEVVKPFILLLSKLKSPPRIQSSNTLLLRMFSICFWTSFSSSSSKFIV